MLWLYSSYLTGCDILDLGESGRYGVYYMRQSHKKYAVYQIVKVSPDIHLSVAKEDIVNSVLFTCASSQDRNY